MGAGGGGMGGMGGGGGGMAMMGGMGGGGAGGSGGGGMPTMQAGGQQIGGQQSSAYIPPSISTEASLGASPPQTGDSQAQTSYKPTGQQGEKKSESGKGADLESMLQVMMKMTGTNNFDELMAKFQSYGQGIGSAAGGSTPMVPNQGGGGGAMGGQSSMG